MNDYDGLHEISEEKTKNKIKKIIILDGIPRGKTRFTVFAKDSGVWVWSINYINVLTAISHKLYWDGNRNRKFYDFLIEFAELSNRYFNFEENYIATMKEKFERNDRVDLLIIHNCSGRLRDLLYKKDCIGIKVVDTIDHQDDRYHYILNCESESYDQEIEKMLKIL